MRLPSAIILSACLGWSQITVNPSVSHQTMGEWEATAQAGDEIAGYPGWVDHLVRTAFDTGISRLRVEFRSGVENPADYWTQYRQGQISNAQWRCYRYSTVNDNADPFSIDWSGFQFSELDYRMDTLVMPMYNYYRARGKKLAINLNYVAFVGQIFGTGCPSGLDYIHDDNPEEYAEVVEAAVRHLRDKYGIVPDYFELLLEPGSPWNATLLAQSGVAAKNRLQAAGFTSIRYIAPSHTDMGNSWIWYDAMMNVPGFPGMISELSYHRYGGVSDANLAAIRTRAQAAGIRSAMLEHIGSGHEDLYDDIVKGRSGSWQQFALAFTGADDGGKYFIIDTATNTVSLGSRTKFLKQYFRHIESGAVRIEASSSDPALMPTAYRNPDGLHVVVVRATAAASFSVSGLPPGLYRIRYTTASAEYADGGSAMVLAGQPLNASIPAAGVLTAFAEPLPLSVLGSTPTQAVIAYDAPNDNPCTIEVSEFPNFSPVVHDVNPSLFAGANSDAGRSLTAGRQRIIVIGRRTSDTAQDGKLYSRALAAATPHYVRVTCGGQQGATSFVTKTLPWGYLQGQIPPFNPDGFGNYAWPTIDWTPAGRDKEYVDPMTGVKMKLLTWPGYHTPRRGESNPGTDRWWDWSGSWTNPQNILSASTSSLASSSTAGAAIYVAVDPVAVAPTPYMGSGAGDFSPHVTIDDFGLRVFGQGTAAAAADRQIAVCVSFDSGRTCASQPVTVTLAQGVSVDNGVFPSGFPTPMFASWPGLKPLRQGLDWPKGGSDATCNVSGNVVTATNPNNRRMFLTTWTSGDKIYIAGSAPTCPHNICTIVSVQSATQLTIQESLTLSGANWRAMNVGFRIWKVTGTGSVSISVRHVQASSIVGRIWAGGSQDWCSPVTTTSTVDRYGNPAPPKKGRLCIPMRVDGGVETYAPVAWVAEDGETRLISIHAKKTSLPNHPPEDTPSPGSAAPASTYVRFDPEDGRTWYQPFSTQSGKLSIFKITYTGDFREFNPNYPPGGIDTATNDNTIWENITRPSQGRDIQTQINNSNTPGYDVSRFGPISEMRGMDSGLFHFMNSFAGQDMACWVAHFNLNGDLVRVFNSWDGNVYPELRWAGCHAGGIEGIPPAPGAAYGWDVLFGTNARGPAARNNTRLLGGPFEAPVIAVKRPSGWDMANTAVSGNINDGSYDAACPTDLPPNIQSMGGTGNNCLTIRVRGEPCSSYPTANELAWWPCPWDAAKSTMAGNTLRVGDWAHDESHSDQHSEKFIVGKITPASGTELEIVLVRNPSNYQNSKWPFPSDCGGTVARRTHANGWVLRPIESYACDSNTFYVDAAPGAAAMRVDNIYGHATVNWLSGGTLLKANGAGFKLGTLQEAINASQAGIKSFSSPAFAGFAGTGGGQSYPSAPHVQASGAERYWIMDAHFIEGSTTRTMSQVPGQTYTWQVQVLGSVDIKRQPIHGWVGHWLLKDISGPNSQISDATPWSYCYAYRAGECVPGSSAGQGFVSAPVIRAATTACPGGPDYTLYNGAPCLGSGYQAVSWVVQNRLHVSPYYKRLITLGLNGHNRNGPFWRADPTPDGAWARVSAMQLDGVRSDFLLVKLPPAEPLDSVNRTTFVPITVTLPAQPGATQAVVDFGYEEFGSRTDFFCTTRRERCTVPGLSPFSFASETISPAPCSSGCTITIPALPQKILYWRARWLNATGNVVQTGNLEAVAVP